MAVAYLLASLPMLSFDHPPAVTVEQFIESCRSQLSRADAEAAELLVTGGDLSLSGQSFVKSWVDREAILRNAIARKRLATKKGSFFTEEGPLPAVGCDLMIEREVEAAFDGSSDPMQREKALDRIRWRVADELAGYNPLARDVVFAYAIKLAITSRWHALSAETGRERISDALPKETLE